jgi:ribose transport system ATP-binding protein
MSTAPLLEMRGISKSFPGVQALSEVRLDLAAGEVHALMGENGAGKSTLVKILCGIHQPDAGTIRLDGTPVTITSPTAALALGISPVHQEVNLQPYLSVAENIFLGRLPRNRLGLVDGRRLRRQATEILESLGVPLDPGQPLGALSVAERQIAAIARAVSTEARILIFDEPTSSLSEREAALLLAMIRRLRDRGLGILYISHRMEEIFRLCDRITVFRDGRHIATKAAAETDLRGVIQLMIGRDLGDLFRKQPAAIGAPVLEVRGLARRGLLHDISFAVRRGEIVGLAGLVGAGRTDLARALFGDLAIDSGEILIEGRPARPRSPRQAIAAGIGLVPEDRKDQGLVTALSVQQNISLPMLRALSHGSIVDVGAERRLAIDYVRRLAIRTPSPEQKVKFLSGGNQQRVVIAKWLATRPKLLIVDEPTRGIDVGAKAEIHALLCDLAREGVAILMISSDLPEILAMSDRVLVMHQGRLAGELPAATATQEAIMHYATGTA